MRISLDWKLCDRARSEARELLLETTGCEGNNILHTAIIKEASDSVKTILRLIEKSGEQEVNNILSAHQLN